MNSSYYGASSGSARKTDFDQHSVPAPAARVPNLRAQFILRDVAEDVSEFIKTSGLEGARADEVAMASVRGAFQAMKHSQDPGTADFATLALVQVNTRGVAALHEFLAAFQATKATPATEH